MSGSNPAAQFSSYLALTASGSSLLLMHRRPHARVTKHPLVSRAEPPDLATTHLPPRPHRTCLQVLRGYPPRSRAQGAGRAGSCRPASQRRHGGCAVCAGGGRPRHAAGKRRRGPAAQLPPCRTQAACQGLVISCHTFPLACPACHQLAGNPERLPRGSSAAPGSADMGRRARLPCRSTCRACPTSTPSSTRPCACTRQAPAHRPGGMPSCTWLWPDHAPRCA